jgi:hypothetical protein
MFSSQIKEGQQNPLQCSAFVPATRCTGGPLSRWHRHRRQSGDDSSKGTSEPILGCTKSVHQARAAPAVQTAVADFLCSQQDNGDLLSSLVDLSQYGPVIF